MARPTWHLPINPKTIIIVASAALVLFFESIRGWGSGGVVLD
jgi:hypothetical protein